MISREPVSHFVTDEWSILFDVMVTPSGSLSAVFRCGGRVSIDGKEYEADRAEVHVKLRKCKD